MKTDWMCGLVLVALLCLCSGTSNASVQDPFERGDIAFVQFIAANSFMPGAGAINHHIQNLSHPAIMVGVSQYDDAITDDQEQIVHLMNDPFSGFVEFMQMVAGRRGFTVEGPSSSNSSSLKNFKTISLWAGVINNQYLGIRAKLPLPSDSLRAEIVRKAKALIGLTGTYKLAGNASTRKNNSIDPLTTPRPTFRSDGFVEYVYEAVGLDIVSQEGATTSPLDQWNALGSTAPNVPSGLIVDKNGQEIPFDPYGPNYRIRTKDTTNGSGIGAFNVEKIDTSVIEVVPKNPLNPPALWGAAGISGDWAAIGTATLQDGTYRLNVWDGAGNRYMTVYNVRHLGHFYGKVINSNGRALTGAPVTVSGPGGSFSSATGWGASAGRFSSQRDGALGGQDKISKGLYTVTITRPKDGQVFTFQRYYDPLTDYNRSADQANTLFQFNLTATALPPYVPNYSMSVMGNKVTKRYHTTFDATPNCGHRPTVNDRIIASLQQALNLGYSKCYYCTIEDGGAP